MKLKKPIKFKRSLTRLAQLKEIRYHTLDGRRKTIKFDKQKWELIWDPIKKILLVTRKENLKRLKVDLKTIENLPTFKMWKDFTAHPVDKVYDLVLNENFLFNKIGKGIHVVYRSDKWNKGDYWDYIHEYGEGLDHVVVKNHGVNVYYDTVNKIYKMSGGKLDVTDKGIIH